MNIFKNIILVIISPKVGWDEVNRTGYPEDSILSKAYLPLLCILGLTSFLRIFYDSISVTDAFINALISCFIYFIEYYVASYLISGFYPELVKTKAGQGRVNSFILYNLIYLLILNIINNLMPIDFTPVMFMTIYVMWITTKGVDFLGLKESKTIKFVLISSALFLIVPFLIILLSR